MELANSIIAMIFILSLLGGSVWLQIFLSKKQNKWLGLIIPLICFMFSIMAILGMALFQNVGTSPGNLHGSPAPGSHGMGEGAESWKPGVIQIIASVTPVFLIFNIPTIIFLAIYYACREKMKLRDELDKMNIQDLD